MSQTGIFLLGGINRTYNFLGTRLARTTIYGVFEVGLKAAPLFLLIGGMKRSQTSSANSQEVFTESTVSNETPSRRSTLTQ